MSFLYIPYIERYKWFSTKPFIKFNSRSQSSQMLNVLTKAAVQELCLNETLFKIGTI